MEMLPAAVWTVPFWATPGLLEPLPAVPVMEMAAPFNPVMVPAEAGPNVEFATLDALMVRKSFVVAMNFFDQRYGHYWVDAELAMPVIAAAFGHDVDNAAGRAAIFRVKTARFYLKFLYQLERDLVVTVNTRVVIIGHFLTVDNKGIFSVCRSVDRKATRDSIGTGARNCL